MDQQAVWQAVQAWPLEDQLDLASHIWDHAVDEGWQPKLTDELKAELDRRWANFQANPDSVLSWEQEVEKIKGR